MRLLAEGEQQAGLARIEALIRVAMHSVRDRGPLIDSLEAEFVLRQALLGLEAILPALNGPEVVDAALAIVDLVPGTDPAGLLATWETRVGEQAAFVKEELSVDGGGPRLCTCWVRSLVSRLCSKTCSISIDSTKAAERSRSRAQPKSASRCWKNWGAFRSAICGIRQPVCLNSGRGSGLHGSAMTRPACENSRTNWTRALCSTSLSLGAPLGIGAILHSANSEVEWMPLSEPRLAGGSPPP